jgi:hypothetical protein
MSTSAQQFSDATATVERRFYSRVVPHAPIYLAIDGSEDTLLLNVSENGLLVSAPVALLLNFVARIAIPLNGLPKPVQVNVRVVWTNEINKQAGIQLMDISEHDREQIRKWGSRESSQFLHRQQDQIVAASFAKPAAVPTAEPALAKSSSTQSKATNKPPVAAPSVSRRNAPEVTTSPAARVALWSMAIAALCLVALFLLKNNALGNSFAHSREILRGSSAAVTALGTPASPQNPDATRREVPTNVASNVATPSPLGSAENTKHVSAGTPSPHDSSTADGRANPARDTANDEEPAASSSVDSDEDQLDTPPVAAPRGVTSTVSPRPDADSRAKSQVAPPASSPNSTANTSVSKTDSASKITSPPNSLATGGTATIPPLVPAAQPIANQPAPNPVKSSDTATRTPAPLPARPDSIPAASSAPNNTVAPLIQMDTPPRQVMEIHLPRGSRGSFLNLPGEHVLESPSATMRIQRSVRMPAGHSVLPLNPFNRSKKVVIGGLMSRVDPQLAQAQIGPGDFIRVIATVDQNGQVQSVKPIRGRATLVPAVLKAVQEWRYQPTLVDGKPVETKCDVLIEFRGAPRYTARQ